MCMCTFALHSKAYVFIKNYSDADVIYTSTVHQKKKNLMHSIRGMVSVVLLNYSRRNSLDVDGPPVNESLKIKMFL